MFERVIKKIPLLLFAAAAQQLGSESPVSEKPAASAERPADRDGTPASGLEKGEKKRNNRKDDAVKRRRERNREHKARRQAQKKNRRQGID